MIKSKNKSIILYDGVCNLCNKSVQFIMKHDHQKQFLFVSLQSDAAVKLLLQLNIKNTNLNSIVFIEDGIPYKKSTAILTILKRIGGFWGMFYFLKIIPKGIRDYMYNLIVNNRYKWFGKCEVCNIHDTDTIENRSI